MSRISPADLEAARRKLARRFASAIVTAMAEMDVSPRQMAEAIGVTEKYVLDIINRLIGGDGSFGIDAMADLFSACGCDYQPRAERRPTNQEPASDE